MTCQHCDLPEFICLDCTIEQLGISRWEMFKARLWVKWRKYSGRLLNHD